MEDDPEIIYEIYILISLVIQYHKPISTLFSCNCQDFYLYMQYVETDTHYS